LAAKIQLISVAEAIYICLTFSVNGVW